MAIQPVGLGVQSNPGRDSAISSARLINCYVESVGEEGKLQLPIVAADSFESRATLTGGGAIAGMLSMSSSALYVVSGSRLFKHTSAGVTSDLGALGNSGWVAMARNRKQGTPQIGILSDDGVFRVLESDALSVVSESFLTGLVDFTVFDGYGVLIKSNGEIYISSSDEFATFDELDFTTADASPHGLLAAATRGSDLMVMGPRASVFYQNTGAADFPLERTTQIDVGCYAPRAVREIVMPQGDSIIWPATDADGAYIGVMALSGYGWEKISHHAVDRFVKAEATNTSIRALTWAEGGHTFYGLHTSSGTWVFDTTTGQWHERMSNGGRWRVQEIVSFAGDAVAGDATTAAIYTMGPSVTNALECTAAVQYSKRNGDAGSWTSKTPKNIGGASERSKRFKWTRLGKSKEDGVILEIKITHAVSEAGEGEDMTIIPPHLHAWPNPIEVHGVYVDVVPGSSQTGVPKAITGLAVDVDAVPLT